jgi:hypothetical protein
MQTFSALRVYIWIQQTCADASSKTKRPKPRNLSTSNQPWNFTQTPLKIREDTKNTCEETIQVWQNRPWDFSCANHNEVVNFSNYTTNHAVYVIWRILITYRNGSLNWIGTTAQFNHKQNANNAMLCVIVVQVKVQVQSLQCMSVWCVSLHVPS